MSVFNTVGGATLSPRGSKDGGDKMADVLASLGKSIAGGSQISRMSTGINLTTERMRNLIAQPNRNISFANDLHGGETKQFHGHEVGRVGFPMEGLGATRANPLSKNCDEYGGVPFFLHAGKHCHRGVKQFKQPNFHPSEINKRIYYRDDGSGRDGYISSNNGGLTVTNKILPFGSDAQTLYVDSLRHYNKDKVSPGYHRGSVPLRIAENYIEKNLKVESHDFSEKYSKKLS